jgi:hypothetical protein
MKKIILSACFLLLSVIAQAKTINYYHLAHKSTPALPYTVELIENFSKQGIKIDFKQGLSCSAKQQVDDQKQTVFVEFLSARYWQSLQHGDNLCNINLDKIKFYASYTSYYDVVVSNGSSIKTFNDLAKAKSIAVPDGSAAYLIVDELNKTFGSQIKKVIFSGSADVAKSVLAGDVDAGIVLDIVSTQMSKNNKMSILAHGDEKINENIFVQLPNLNKAVVANSYLFAIKNADSAFQEKIISNIKVVKQELDKKMPGNNFQIVSNKDDKSVEQLAQLLIFELYELTKVSR